MTRRDLCAERQFSPAVEDYLKAIFLAQQTTGTATNGEIAARLGRLKPASVTGMVQRLASLGLVSYTPHRGVRLLPAGERIAQRVMRHNRLIELYLIEALGLGLDAVQAEADQLEHVISDDMERRIVACLSRVSEDVPAAGMLPT